MFGTCNTDSKDSPRSGAERRTYDNDILKIRRSTHRVSLGKRHLVDETAKGFCNTRATLQSLWVGEGTA